MVKLECQESQEHEYQKARLKARSKRCRFSIAWRRTVKVLPISKTIF